MVNNNLVENIISKSAFNWNFTENDWFINIVLNKAEIRHKIFILKNYSASRINDIVYNICLLVKEYRTELEKTSPSFITKKNFLILHNKDDNIQISLEDEYILKDLIEKYKIYELISWFHLGKNADIFKHCTLEKQKILKQIYPIIDLSIRKVIGSKVIDIKNKNNYDLFEEAVNNAWLAIIKYLTKIDTSKVMFSILVGTAHRSAIYFKAIQLKYKYNVVRINDLNFVNDTDDDEVTEDVFINTVINNNSEYNSDSFEDNIIDNIDNKINNDDFYYLENNNAELDDIIDSIENPEKSNCLQQNILAHSFDILSGKIKKICFEKIFAEFFYDLINSKISEKVINRHTQILIDIMDLISINPEIVNDIEKNIEVYKLFRSWIKEKMNNKLIKFNINSNNKNVNKIQLSELLKREYAMLNYLKNNKKDTLKKLIEFKSNCINFKK